MNRLTRSTLLLTALLLVGCGEDESPVKPPCPDCGLYPPPPGKEYVLNNLELAYNQRNIARFQALLDAEFTFFFAPADVGGNIPPQWGRAEEIQNASLMFDKSLNAPGYPRLRSLRVDIKFESGMQWTGVIPASHPDETWYTTTLFYELTVQIDPDGTYIAAPGSKAQFTLRNAGTADGPDWKLVEWRDFRSPPPPPGLQAEIIEKSWGGLKALFVPPGSP